MKNTFLMSSLTVIILFIVMPDLFRHLSFKTLKQVQGDIFEFQTPS